MQTKHKLKRAGIISLVFALLSSVLINLNFSAPAEAAFKNANYEHIAHTIKELDLSNIVGFDCQMQLNRTFDEEGKEYFEYLTNANFYKGDNSETQAYSPDYEWLDKQSDEKFTYRSYNVNDFLPEIDSSTNRYDWYIKKSDGSKGAKLTNGFDSEGKPAGGIISCSDIAEQAGIDMTSSSGAGENGWVGTCPAGYHPAGMENYYGTGGYEGSTTQNLNNMQGRCRVFKSNEGALTHDVARIDYDNGVFFTSDANSTTISVTVNFMTVDGGEPFNRSLPTGIDDLTTASKGVAGGKIFYKVFTKGTQNGKYVDQESKGWRIEVQNIEKNEDSGTPYRVTYSLIKDGFKLDSNIIKLYFNACAGNSVALDGSAGFSGVQYACTDFTKEGTGSVLENSTAVYAYLQSIVAMRKAADKEGCMANDGAMGYMDCEGLEKLEDTIGPLYTGILELLKLKTSDMMNGTDGALEKTTEAANVMLIALLLAVIVSQVSGFGISNYGLKAMLPRLIVAGILVNTAGLICTLSLDLATVVANFLARELAVIANISGGSAFGSGEAQAMAVGLLAAVGVIAGIVDKSLIIPALVALLGVAVAVLFLFAIVQLRRALVVVLVILSPIAFACYAFPLTRGIFNQWLNYFKNALMLYPIATGMVYGGIAASAVASQTASTTGSTSALSYFFDALLEIMIQVAPIFMIPKALSSSVGAINNAVGAVKNKAAGLAQGGGQRLLQRSFVQRAADRQKQERADRYQSKLAAKQYDSDKKRLSQLQKKKKDGKLSPEYEGELAAVQQRVDAQRQQREAVQQRVGAGKQAKARLQSAQNNACVDENGAVNEDGLYENIATQTDFLNNGNIEEYMKLNDSNGSSKLKGEEGVRYHEKMMEAAKQSGNTAIYNYHKSQLKHMRNGEATESMELYFTGSGFKTDLEKQGKNGLASLNDEEFLAIDNLIKYTDNPPRQHGPHSIADQASDEAVAYAMANDNSHSSAVSDSLNEAFVGMDAGKQASITEALSVSDLQGARTNTVENLAVASASSQDRKLVEQFKSVDGASARAKLSGSQRQAFMGKIGLKQEHLQEAPTSKTMNEINQKLDNLTSAPAPAPAPGSPDPSNPAPEPTGSSEPNPTDTPTPAPVNPQPTNSGSTSMPAAPTQSAMPTISGKEMAGQRPPQVSDFQYEENGQTQYNVDAIYSSPAFKSQLEQISADDRADKDVRAMASQLAGAKNPEQMHRVIRGFDTQFQTLGRTDGKSATDLRNEIFTQFVDNVGQQEQARVAASQPAPAPQMGEITEVDIQRGERQQQAEARRQRIDAELRASSSAPVPQMESVDVLNIDHSTPVSSPRTPAQSEPAPQMGEIDPLTQAAMEHDFKEARQKEQAQARQERIMREGTARSIERDKQRAATMADGPAKEQLLRDIAAAEKSNTPPTPPTMEGIDVPHND